MGNMNNFYLSMTEHRYRNIFLYFLITLFMVFSCVLAEKAECSNSITDYIAVPPFLSAGVDGNLLLMLDNSGSMYDLAYVDEQEYCYDDTYNATKSYAGYFEPDIWYYYNQNLDQFEPREGNWSSLGSSTEWDSATGDEYYNDYVHIKINSNTVTAFFAKGNYLNWATASKLDIQKKILTGGKYEASGEYGAPNGRLVMESRGCLDRNFVKQVPVTSGSTSYYLILGVRSPRELEYPAWESGTLYQAGDIVTDVLDFYKATTSGISSGTGVADDTVNWELYTPYIRWTNGTTYPANSIVSDDGKMWITENGGTASGTCAADDTGVDWVQYNVTHIEIFPITEDGFDATYCQKAIEEMGKASPNQGQLKSDIDECMGYESGGGQSKEADSHAAFNNSIQNCWYLAKHGEWQPGDGSVSSVQNACQNIYEKGTDPWDIDPWDMGYVCYGVWTGNATSPIGYVGRCWNPGENATWECIKWHPHTGECQKWDCSGGVGPHWDAAGYDSPDACIDAALKEYCGYLQIPEVIDPSDQASETNELWNIPAVLIDSGVVAQVGRPIAVFKGYIKQDQVPSGLVQEFADELRIGAMVFNDYGSKTECEDTSGDVDPHIQSHCEAGNEDGGQIISCIGDNATQLVSAINAIKATCWTPLAEAMYTAIGYYTQRTELRLNDDDFANCTDPIQYWCQNNNVLVITEGASTADRNQAIINFAYEDNDTTNIADCGSLDGSTYLDDLTHYAWHGDIYPVDGKKLDGHDKYKIKTHIVVAGTLRSTGTDECSPDVLLENAAQNGGTELYNPTDPSDLEKTLKEVFSLIRKDATTGSAASVISASRSGEGAIYQAIFFPEDSDVSGNKVNWWGEVHALFVDDYGNMHEDTNENDTLDMNTDKIVIFQGETPKANLYNPAGFDPLNPGPSLTDANVTLSNLKFIWNTNDWLGDPNMDVLTQRSPYASTESKRYIFTDYIDTSKSVSMANVKSTEIMDFTTDFVNDAANDNYYFLNPEILGANLTETEMTAEAQNIIKFVRGQEGLNATKTGTPYRNRTLSIDGNDRVYRLGDIIYSTPTVVSRPMEDYDLLYMDDSYRLFRKKYLNRRTVVYAGANDGMLHAFNGGFYDEDLNKFKLQNSGETQFELGAELWAYVPNALLPHLKWLKEELNENIHVYYVDLKPRIFDAKIFTVDDDHPGGWGTVLLGGMRLGGGPIGVDTTVDGAGNPDPDGIDDLNFRSTYFALDITNPEKPPKLLWSFSDENLGFTTCYPTPIIVGNEWFIVVGSGPNNYDATCETGYGGSNRLPSLYILNAYTGVLEGNFTMNEAGPSFLANPIAVDFDLATTTDNVTGETLWTGEAIYVASDGCNATGSEGQVFRIKTNQDEDPNNWTKGVFFNPNTTAGDHQHINSALSVAKDDKGRIWVYFGTGRFWSTLDRQSRYLEYQNSFYGIKEPVDANGALTYATPGAQKGNLLNVTGIEVIEEGEGEYNNLFLPIGASVSNHDDDGNITFSDLLAEVDARDGWYLNFSETGERNLGQAAILGDIVTFSTFVPNNDLCQYEGESYLYGLYYKTGTAYWKGVLKTNDNNGTGIDPDTNKVIYKLDLGKGYSETPNIHTGREEGSKAFVQTSTGAIIGIEQMNPGITKSKKASWEEWPR